MQTFTFYMTFDDGRKLTKSIDAYGLLGAVGAARKAAFEMINKVWIEEHKRLILTGYMVK